MSVSLTVRALRLSRQGKLGRLRRTRWSAVLAVAAIVVLVWLPVGILFWDAWVGGARLAALDQRFWILLEKSVLVAGGTAMLAALIGLPIGLLLARVQLPARPALRALQIAPLLVPSYISAIGWIHIAGRNGELNRWLGKWLGGPGPVIDLYTPAGVIWILGLGAFPIVTLIVIAALEHTSPDYEEEARLVAPCGTVLRAVTLPLITPALLAAMLIVFILALGEFAVPSFLGVNVYTVEVFVRFGAFFDYRAGAVAALPLFVVVLLAFAAQRRLGNRWETAGEQGSQTTGRLLDPGVWRWPACAFCLSAPALAAGAPLLALAGRAPALQDYALVWQTARAEVYNSVLFAVLAATLAVGLGLPLAAWVVRARAGALRATGEWLILSALAVPGAVIGIGLIRLWNRGVPLVWIYQSLWIVVLAMLTRALSLAAIVLASAWRQVPVVYEEYARVEGASPLQAFGRVLMPLLRPGLAAAWSLAFVAAMTELQTVLLVYPPGHATLPVRIYTLQHDGIAENVAALCLVFLAVTLVPVGVAWMLGRSREGAG